MVINKKQLLHTTLNGIVAGLVLTLFFKMIQSWTDYKVYTLLLNIDYIPFANQFQFPEIVEVSFHLVVSIVLSFFLVMLIRRFQTKSTVKIIVLCVCISFLIGALYFPSTLLSDRTPPITSLPSLFYWMIGHVLYGYILGILLSNRYLTK